jgi:hypothetical protein
MSEFQYESTLLRPRFPSLSPCLNLVFGLIELSIGLPLCSFPKAVLFGKLHMAQDLGIKRVEGR